MYRALPTALLLLSSSLVGAAQTAATQTISPSPSQRQIALARTAIKANPAHPQHYNDLAAALTRFARHSQDPVYYRLAEEALIESFRLAPDNFDGQKIEVEVFLGRGEYVRALETAKKLNMRIADDVSVYGLIADAAIGIGDYKEAEDAVQRMLNLRHSGAAIFVRVARLRRVFGDIQGASEAFDFAFEGTHEAEERASLLTEIADLALNSGDITSAEKRLRQALKVLPDHHPALVNLARVRSSQQRHAEAVDLLRRAHRNVSQFQTLYALAKALGHAGRREEAKQIYAEFEQKAHDRAEHADNANRELVFYYADHARQPAEALRIARLEVARRQDVHTLDAYAWALYANRNYAAAREQIEKVLAVGYRDADLLYRAGSIFAKLKDRAAARRCWEQSIALNPLSSSAKRARAALTGAAPIAARPHR